MKEVDERCTEDLRRLERAENDSALIVRDGPMERRLEFVAGYDHRGFNCGHGQHGMSLRFTLSGPAGAVQFVANMTNWVPGSVKHGQVKAVGDVSLISVAYPEIGDGMAWDLGYHSPEEQYEGQTRMDHCHLLPQGFCYYDGSGLNAEPVLAAFMEHGPMVVWATLARYYIETFGKTER